MLHPDLVPRRQLDRERDPRITHDVLQLLLVGREVAADELVPVDADPDARDLWTAVTVEGDEMSERSGLDRRAGLVGQLGHAPNYPSSRASR